jgi:hypothetical protein
MLLKEKYREVYVTGRRERRRKQLLNYLKLKRGYSKFREELLNIICGELAFNEGNELSSDRQTDRMIECINQITDAKV